MKKRRFETIYTEGATRAAAVIVDHETGVHYLFIQSGYGGGLTPLLDADGKPVISPVISDYRPGDYKKK